MAVIAFATLYAVVMVVRDGLGTAGSIRALQWVPIIESGVNDLVFAGLAIVFLYAAPDRVVRRRTLDLLHRLRSLAHVIDMHQLTKDPERLHRDFTATGATDPLGMTAIELANYLDYCSEMLSLVAKAAALCAEDSTDTVVLESVRGIETMTAATSNKIWQKISLLPPQ